jgi:hypothetical protein
VTVLRASSPRQSTARFLPILACLLSLGLVVSSGRALAQDGTGGPGGAATPATSAALEASVAWLVGQQMDDGGFPGFAGTSDPGVTCDAVSALAAASIAGLDVAEPLARAYEFLAAGALEYSLTGTGQAAKLVLAAVAAGEDPRDVGGIVALELVEKGANEDTGIYGLGVFDHALALLALAAAGEDVPEAAFDALAATQLDDGSWAFDGSTAEGAGDSNTTAMVVQALVAAGQVDSPLIPPALAYLASIQTESGGFAFQQGEAMTPDANSTALAVQALIAAGLNPSAPDLHDPAAALAGFQNPSGAFRYNDDAPDDNLFATVQAIPALVGLPLPIVPAGGAGTPVAV